jgi:hypothetical protein
MQTLRARRNCADQNGRSALESDNLRCSQEQLAQASPTVSLRDTHRL